MIGENTTKNINLLEFDLPELENWLEQEFAQPKFRARQIWSWIWQKLARDFSGMSNVSKELRAKLEQVAVIDWPEVVSRQQAEDGTIKLLLRLADGEQIETVLIPAEDKAGNLRWSQCISTQVGCPMACTFCATGQMGFRRNLSKGEILAQVLVGRHQLGDLRPDRPILRNLVFMGMGEPLLNPALTPALKCLNREGGLCFSPRRMTVSTCGIEKGLAELGASGLAFLAVSLHAPNQELRKEIMPRAALWPLEEMLAALKSYPLKTRERITFEYLLLGGVNDQPEHARQLARIAATLKSKFNLIVYNPTPGLPYRAPKWQDVLAFQKYLCDRNITAIIRKSRGSEISAACGQLATECRKS